MNLKKIILFSSIGIFVILVVVVLYFIFFSNVGKQSVNNIGNKTESDYKTIIVDNNLNDIDRDGVTDVEETKIGTSNTEFDTDFDGVSDNLELKYGTDPTNSDTDGDGFPDGLEIVRGFNPKGEGKLNPIN